MFKLGTCIGLPVDGPLGHTYLCRTQQIKDQSNEFTSSAITNEHIAN